MQSSDALQQIFIQTRDGALSQCIGTDWGYTDKPDFRFSLGKTQNRNWETYAELLFKRANLLCNLRIDGMNQQELQNTTSNINFHPHPARATRPNENLASFTINVNQIDDAINLIFQAFNHHLVNS